MSSRQSTVAASVSQNLIQYQAPNGFALAQNDISLGSSNSNPAVNGLVKGLGTSAAATQTLPILSSSGANHGLTSSSTTATCTLGTPHGYAIGASAITASIFANNAAYNVTNATVAFISPYAFTYTTTGSSLAVSDGGTAVITVPAWSATQSANQGFSPLPAGTAVGTTGQPFYGGITGITYNSATVGTVEVWGDGCFWDTTNNRAVSANAANIDPAFQFHSA
jgi:hypothetical protein